MRIGEMADDDWIDVLQRQIDRLSPAQRRKRANKLARKTGPLVSVPRAVEIIALCNPVSVREVADQIRGAVSRGELPATWMH